jgi:hypothetical protein
MQRGSAFIVDRTYIRTVLEQHAYDLDLPTVATFLCRSV